jgi:aromatic-L-amino-acid/L-tryptophan decarboxylase
VGFPHAPGAGLLTSGASAATIVCFAGARSRALAAAGHDVRRDGLAGAPQLIAYVPAEAHSCVRRALELLGLGSSAMREVPLEGGRLDAPALRASIAADRASGALPALLVGSAGTVNAGAIDPLDALADVAAAEKLWFHVDGAYGAFGVLDPATLVERDPELELAAAPETSIVAFRARPADCPSARLDELNRALPEAVQARGRAFVTGTVFGGRETLRACILHPDTSSEHLATLIAEVVATARTLAAAG